MSSVINAFFGASLALWARNLYEGVADGKWWFMILFPFFAALAYLLAISLWLPRQNKLRWMYAVGAWGLTFFIALILQLCKDSGQPIGTFTTAPGTWYLFLIVLLWFFTGNFYRAKEKAELDRQTSKT